MGVHSHTVLYDVLDAVRQRTAFCSARAAAAAGPPGSARDDSDARQALYAESLPFEMSRPRPPLRPSRVPPGVAEDLLGPGGSPRAGRRGWGTWVHAQTVLTAA